ncbi:MAG TPA: hypothetical protein VM553_17880 [Dongiaceae bacterium]|nr:hypothetical protein [Dongiaceae bacterium]
MRTRLWLAGIVVGLVAPLTLAVQDFSDIDGELMKAMEDTNKFLEPDIGGRNKDSAKEGAQFLLEGLQWTEQYFASKGPVADAVKISQEGQQHARDILQALDKDEFEKAAAAARLLTKNCKSCHDLYKPRQG